STTSAPSGLTKVMRALVTATRLGQSRISARLSGAFRALRQLVLAALELVQRVLEVEARVGIRIVERHRVAEVPDRIRKECRRERRVANGEGEVEDSDQIPRLRPPGMIFSGLLDVLQRNLRLGAERLERPLRQILERAAEPEEPDGAPVADVVVDPEHVAREPEGRDLDRMPERRRQRIRREAEIVGGHSLSPVTRVDGEQQQEHGGGEANAGRSVSEVSRSLMRRSVPCWM